MNHLTRKRFIRFLAIKDMKRLHQIYLKQGKLKIKLSKKVTRVDATKKDETPQESLPLMSDLMQHSYNRLRKREHQLPAQFRSFKEKATEGHQNINRGVDWTSYLNKINANLLNQVRYLRVLEV